MVRDGDADWVPVAPTELGTVPDPVAGTGDTVTETTETPVPVAVGVAVCTWQVSLWQVTVAVTTMVLVPV